MIVSHKSKRKHLNHITWKFTKVLLQMVKPFWNYYNNNGGRSDEAVKNITASSKALLTCSVEGMLGIAILL